MNQIQRNFVQVQDLHGKQLEKKAKVDLELLIAIEMLLMVKK